jgi:hypothetical protein
MFINTNKTHKIDRLIKSLDAPTKQKKTGKKQKAQKRGASFKPLDNDYTY